MKKDKLINLWSKVCKLKVGNRCEYPYCNNTDRLNAHHIIARSNNATRYDPFNCMILCSHHHTLGGCSAHKDPYFKDVIIENGVRTAKFFRDLKIKSNQIVKQRDAQAYWRPILEKELERLQNNTNV
jgi:hypothetical protein